MWHAALVNVVLCFLYEVGAKIWNSYGYQLVMCICGKIGNFKNEVQNVYYKF